MRVVRDFCRSRSRAGGGGAAAAWPKRLYLVRHGQSEYNAHYEQHSRDPMDMWDAPLTAVGREQAAALRPAFERAGCMDLAVMSPLTRAMETCMLAAPLSSGAAARYLVVPTASEHLEASCDIGRPGSELRRAFPELPLQDLPEVWWYVPPDHSDGDLTPDGARALFSQQGRREPRSAFERRVDAFAEWLAGRPEARIAVFAHADFFHTLLGRHFARRDGRFAEYWMKNCELLELEVPGPQDLLDPLREAAEHQPCEQPLPEEAGPPRPSAASAAQQALLRLKEEIRASSPEMSKAQLVAAAARRWKELGAEERQRLMGAAAG